tara:strand:- start:2086 stop:2658 length:573 start_codon:yes stop_codon:yes gene_type:complete
MWKQNKLGGYEQTPIKTGTKKQKNPIRSGWYSHPDSGETVWYDSKTNQFRDKVGGPTREALSIGWRLSGGKDAADLVGMTIKGAKKVIPAIYKWDKRSKDLEKQFDKDVVSGTGKLLNKLLVNKKDPGFTNVKDTTGITKGREAVENDVKNLKPSPTEKNPTVVTGKESNKKKIMITQEQIHKALRNSGE